MPDKPSEVAGGAILAAMVLPRIAAPGDIDTLPSVIDDEAHRDVARQALKWQELGTNAQLWELGAYTQGSQEGRAFALAGQMAAVGEQLGLAYGAGVEVALWDEHRQEAEDVAEIEMGTRAMAEAQSYFLMGAAHGLANVCLYALAMDNTLLAHLQRDLGRKDPSSRFQPFSDNRADWISMNPNNAEKLLSCAKTSSSSFEVRAMVTTVDAFARSSEWADLETRRSEDFHRWRPQSHGMAGVEKASPWNREGHTRSLGVGPMPTYGSAEGLAQEVAATADRAMIRLAEAMGRFMERFISASALLGGPRFK